MIFINKLRKETHYPNFRLLAQIAVGVMYLVGFGGVFVATTTGEAGIIFIAMAALGLFLVLVHALYEAAVMIVDIADATVRMATDTAAREPDANLDWDRPVLPAGSK